MFPKVNMSKRKTKSDLKYEELNHYFLTITEEKAIIKNENISLDKMLDNYLNLKD